MNRLCVSLLIAAVPGLASAAGLEAAAAAGARQFAAPLGAALAKLLPQDAFLETTACRIADAKSLRPFSIDQAEKMLQPCAKALAARYGQTVDIKSGLLEPKVSGLAIRLEPGASAASPLVRDIQYGLSKRGGRLLGHPARLVRDPLFRPMIQSSLQETIDRCVLPAVIRRIETVDDVIGVYGRCLTQDRGLRIRLLAASEARERVLRVFSRADDATLAGMNGWITVPSAGGPAAFEVEAHPAD